MKYIKNYSSFVNESVGASGNTTVTSGNTVTKPVVKPVVKPAAKPAAKGKAIKVNLDKLKNKGKKSPPKLTPKDQEVFAYLLGKTPGKTSENAIYKRSGFLNEGLLFESETNNIPDDEFKETFYPKFKKMVAKGMLTVTLLFSLMNGLAGAPTFSDSQKDMLASTPGIEQQVKQVNQIEPDPNTADYDDFAGNDGENNDGGFKNSGAWENLPDNWQSQGYSKVINTLMNFGDLVHTEQGISNDTYKDIKDNPTENTDIVNLMLGSVISNGDFVDGIKPSTLFPNSTVMIIDNGNSGLETGGKIIGDVIEKGTGIRGLELANGMEAFQGKDYKVIVDYDYTPPTSDISSIRVVIQYK